jgi:hypothetical protein
VDKNSTVVFPAPLMSTIAELAAFLARESKAAAQLPAPPGPAATICRWGAAAQMSSGDPPRESSSAGRREPVSDAGER